MLKILIANHEEVIINGIKSLINLKELDFEICEENVINNDAYTRVKKLKPDLIIIDIRMKERSNMLFIKECIESGYKGGFIIIGENLEKSSIREVIEFEVNQCLVKMTEEDKLLDTIHNFKNEIVRKSETIGCNDFQKQLMKSNSLERLCYKNNIEELSEKIEKFNYSSYNLALINCTIDEFSSKNLIEIEEYIKKKLVVTKGTEIFRIKNNIAILFGERSENSITNILENLKIKIEKDFSVDIFITISMDIDGIENLSKAYRNTVELMYKKFLYMNHGIISNKVINSKVYNGEETVEQIIEDIYTYIEIGEKQKIRENVSKIADIIKSKGYSEEKSKALIITNFLKYQSELIVNYKLNLNTEKRNENIIEEIYIKENLDEMLSFLEEEFIITTDLLLINSTDNSIKRIVKFVDKKYHNDLKLEYLSEIFNYNSSYLGKLFRSTTGKSFNNYLDSIRIEKAKELILQDRYKVYEVCEMVGYKNIDYFYCKFKKYVGVSPLNYRKKIINKDMVSD